MVSAGLRRNNPGNVRTGQPWQGLTEQQDDSGFCTFVDPEHGIRAMMLILHTYAGRGITTIEGIITAWAPSEENNTEAYINDVVGRLGVKPTDNLIHPARGTQDKPATGDAYTRDAGTVTALCKAIIHHENGRQPYADKVFQDAWKLADIA